MNKINLKIIAIVIISFLAVLFVASKLFIHNNSALNNIEIANFRKTIIDSVSTANDKNHIIEISRIKDKNSDSIKALKKNVTYWMNIAELYRKATKKTQIKADSIALLKPECNDIAKAYINVIDSIKKENNALDSANYNLDIEAEKYSRNLYLTEKQLSVMNVIILRKDSILQVKDSHISILEKNSLRTTWFNGFKWGVGIGYAAGIGTVALIK